MAESTTVEPVPTGAGADTGPDGDGRSRSTASLVAAVVLGFLYSYYEWEAITSLVELPAFYAGSNAVVPSTIWVLLVVGVVVPVIVFVLAVALGRRRSFMQRLALLVVGFAVVGAASLGGVDLAGIFSRG